MMKTIQNFSRKKSKLLNYASHLAVALAYLAVASDGFAMNPEEGTSDPTSGPARVVNNKEESVAGPSGYPSADLGDDEELVRSNKLIAVAGKEVDGQCERSWNIESPGGKSLAKGIPYGTFADSVEECTSGEADFISEAPLELGVAIFAAGLSPQDIFRARCVNTKWRNLGDTDYVWQVIAQRLPLRRLHSFEASLSWKGRVVEHELLVGAFIAALSDNYHEAAALFMQARAISLRSRNYDYKKLYLWGHGSQAQYYPTVLKVADLLIAQGCREAFEIKLDALLCDHQAPQAFLFIEDLVSRDYPPAVAKKFIGLAEGKYGYCKNQAQARALNEESIKKGSMTALIRKVKFLTSGSLVVERNADVYENDQAQANELVEKLIAEGNTWAADRKMDGLAEGKYGYKQDLAAAKSLIDGQAALGNHHAQYLKFHGLVHGENGYDQDLDAAMVFNEWLIQNNPTKIGGILRKIDGLAKGQYGYKQDLAAARSLIDGQVALGNRHAQSLKFVGLAEGKYGYNKDLDAAMVFNERLVAAGDKEALLNKLSGFVWGEYGYERDGEDCSAIQDFIEGLISEGNERAISMKAGWLLRGLNGYEKNLQTFKAFIEEQAQRNSRVAIDWKLLGDATGDADGYEQNLVEFRDFNDRLAALGNPDAIVRQAIWLAKGLFGYEANPEAATRLVAEHKVHIVK